MGCLWLSRQQNFLTRAKFLSLSVTSSKVLQWNWRATHGENVHVVMLGGLHMEMVLWTMCGDLLALAGWTTAVDEAGIASEGTSDSSLKVAHFTKFKPDTPTRYLQQLYVNCSMLPFRNWTVNTTKRSLRSGTMEWLRPPPRTSFETWSFKWYSMYWHSWKRIVKTTSLST